MTNVKQLITEHLDIWLTAETEKKSGRGRSSGSNDTIYGVQKLRELILDLAVKGKLIPQCEKDQDANSLIDYSVILNNKAVENGILKKSKKLSLIDYNTEFKSIPRKWAITSIPFILKNHEYAIKRGPFGSAIQKSFFVDSGYKIYEQQHAINDNFYIGNYYITAEKFEELKAFEVQAEDIIISCSGTVGKVAIAPNDLEAGIINQALLKISLNQDIMLNNYFKILFPTYFMKIDKFSNLKGTAQKNMPSVDEIKSTPFLLPPIEEQQRIVEKVDELMQLCDQLEQQQTLSSDAHATLVDTLLKALTESNDADEFQDNWQRIVANFDVLFTTEHSIEQLKQTVLQLAVMGKLVKQDPSDEPASELLKKIADEKAKLIKEGKIKKTKPLPEITEDENPFELPSGWEFARLSNVLDVRDGTHDSPKDYKGDDFRYLVTSKNFENGNINFETARKISVKDYEEIIKRSNVEEDDILFSMIGGNIGNQLIVKGFSEFAIKNVALFKYFNKLATYPYFIKLFTSYIAIDLQEKALGGAQPFVGLGTLRELIIGLPPINEQKCIVEKVDQLFSIIDQLQVLQSKLQKTKLHLTDALVANAVEGV